MPVITRAQATAISRGVYVDRQNSLNNQRFTPIPLGTLLSPSGINFTNNQIPYVGDPGNQVFTLNPIGSSTSVLTLVDKPDSSQNKVDALATNFVLGAPGFTNATNNTLAGAAGNIKKFADRVKNGYCNLSIIADSLFKPSNNYIFQALFASWNPVNWRGIVTNSYEPGAADNLYRLLEKHGQTGFSFGTLGAFTPPSAPFPLYSTNTTISNATTLSADVATTKLLDQGTYIVPFTQLERTNYSAATTDTSRNRYWGGGVSAAVFGGGDIIYRGYLKDTSDTNVFSNTVGKFLHTAGNLNTINSFTRRSASPVANAIKCSMCFIKPRNVETLPQFKVIVHNGTKSPTDINGTYDGFFVPYDAHQGNYGNNISITTVNPSLFSEYSINVVDLGRVNETSTSVNAGNVFSWYMFIDGSDTTVPLTNASDADRYKVVCTPRFRFHNTAMTTGLQVSTDGNAGYKAKQVAGLDVTASPFFGVSNMTVGGNGNIDLLALTKRFEFEGTNTVMIALGTNDIGDSAANVFQWLTSIYNKVVEAWGIAKLNNPECGNNGELLVNFLLPFTTSTGTAAANNTMLTSLTSLMKTFVAQNPNCSYISQDEIMNRSFISAGTFATGAGNYSTTAAQGWDLDTGAGTNYFFAQDNSNVHPLGLTLQINPFTTDWSLVSTNPACLLMKGVWTILNEASTNLNYTIHGYLEPLGRNGGSLTSETTTVSSVTYQRVTDRDYNYHITGLGILRKIK